MPQRPPALPHGQIEDLFDGVFTVTGAMEATFGGQPWRFNRNMTVIRDAGDLALVNAVRLDEAGLAELDNLGRVRHVVRIGALHDRDSAFYRDHYDVTFWTLPGLDDGHGRAPDRHLDPNGPPPIRDASVFTFRQTRLPEGILHLDRDGGILVACDALQNWLGPDEHFDAGTVRTMREMGFFERANLGPVWVQANDPQSGDFERLKSWTFRHMIPGHGTPLRDTAWPEFAARFHAVFGI